MNKYTFLLVKEGLKSIKFWISVSIAFLLMIIGISESLSQYFEYGTLTTSYFSEFMTAYDGSKALIAAFPSILCVIPFVTRYVQENTSGFEKNVVSRIGNKKYFRAIIISNAILSGLVFFISMTFFLLFVVFIFSSNVSVEEVHQVFRRTVFEGFGNSAYVYIFFIILHSTFFGMVYGTLGICFTFFIKKKFVGLIIPFAFYTIFSLLAMHLGITKIESKATFVITLVSDNTIFHIYGSLILLFIGSVILAYKKFERDILNGEEF